MLTMHDYIELSDTTRGSMHKLIVRHGPISNKSSFASHMCPTCNVAWPCTTFELIYDHIIFINDEESRDI